MWTTSISQGLILYIDFISQGPLVAVHRLAEVIGSLKPDLSTFTTGNRKQLSRAQVSLSHWAGALERAQGAPVDGRPGAHGAYTERAMGT